MRRTQVLFGAAPTPSAVGAEDTTGKLIQGAPIRGRRKGREPAVPYNFSRHSLQKLFLPPFQHLQIRVTVNVDKSWSYDQPAAIDFNRVRKILELTQVLNPAIFDQQVRQNGGSSGAIDNASVLED